MPYPDTTYNYSNPTFLSNLKGIARTANQMGTDIDNYRPVPDWSAPSGFSDVEEAEIQRLIQKIPGISRLRPVGPGLESPNAIPKLSSLWGEAARYLRGVDGMGPDGPPTIEVPDPIRVNPVDYRPLPGEMSGRGGASPEQAAELMRYRSLLDSPVPEYLQSIDQPWWSSARLPGMMKGAGAAGLMNAIPAMTEHYHDTGDAMGTLEEGAIKGAEGAGIGAIATSLLQRYAPAVLEAAGEIPLLKPAAIGITAGLAAQPYLDDVNNAKGYGWRDNYSTLFRNTVVPWDQTDYPSPTAVPGHDALLNEAFGAGTRHPDRLTEMRHMTPKTSAEDLVALGFDDREAASMLAGYHHPYQRSIASATPSGPPHRSDDDLVGALRSVMHSANANRSLGWADDPLEGYRATMHRMLTTIDPSRREGLLRQAYMASTGRPAVHFDASGPDHVDFGKIAAMGNP